MGKLYRPHITLSVKVQVAERQVKEKPNLDWGFYLCVCWQNNSDRLEMLKRLLAKRFKCEVKDLRLDHDPPLGARQIRSSLMDGKITKTTYYPDANDPDHLFYRPHGPQFEGSHLIKTNVRGDHGQHPDRVLIKKQRRLERASDPAAKPRRPKQKLKSRGFDKRSRPFPKRRKA